jgi:hypothetical protein
MVGIMVENVKDESLKIIGKTVFLFIILIIITLGVELLLLFSIPHAERTDEMAYWGIAILFLFPFGVSMTYGVKRMVKWTNMIKSEESKNNEYSQTDRLPHLNYKNS